MLTSSGKWSVRHSKYPDMKCLSIVLIDLEKAVNFYRVDDLEQLSVNLVLSFLLNRPKTCDFDLIVH